MTKGWADGHIKDPGPKMKIIKRWVMCIQHHAGNYSWKHIMLFIRKGLS